MICINDMASGGMRYVKCPCGRTDGNDDLVESIELIDLSYNADECILLEERKCDICGQVRRVKMHFKFGWEEMEYEG